MTEGMDFIRYLEAKKSVDDRALNALVWKTLQERMAAIQAERLVHVVEIGAGIGTMLERLVERRVLCRGSYTGVDADETCLQAAHNRLPVWSARLGWEAERWPEGWRLRSGHGVVDITFVHTDEQSFTRRADHHERWDVLIANAFLDLVPLDRALPSMMRLLLPGGLFYFSINFDGVTIFLPAIEPGLDEPVIDAYHQTMDDRRLEGRATAGSRAGRQLLVEVPAAGASILAAGASDWIVRPHDGGYPSDEAYFLRFILHTLESALAGSSLCEARPLERWLQTRLHHLDQGALIYIAHQLDLCGVRT